MYQRNDFDNVARVAQDRRTELLDEAKRWQLLKERPVDDKGYRNWWQALRRVLERFHGGHPVKPVQPSRPVIQH